MDGTHRGPFRFTCPLCFAKPGKPCVETKGPKKGKTCETHWHRKTKFRKATYAEREPVIWTNAVETNPRRH